MPETVTVRNLRPFDVEVPIADGPSVFVEAGGTAEVPADVGKRLLQQSDVWGPAGEGRRKSTSSSEKEKP